MQSITCAAVTPPTVKGENFIDVDKTIPLYVPEQSIELYAAADEWKEFTNILPLRSEDVDLVHEVSNTTYKLLHNGHFLILRGDNTYTLTGQEVK